MNPPYDQPVSWYDTLVSSGFTSPVMAGCVLDRNMTDASTIATALRRRHDGRNRSPWNEPECGLLYSRAMAHWNIFDQCCGHVYDSHAGSLSFDPRTSPTDFSCFVSLNGGWGQYIQKGNAGLTAGTLTISCTFGSLQLNSLTAVSTATSATATLDGKVVPSTFSKGTVHFSATVAMAAGSTLTVTLSSPDSAMIDFSDNPETASCCAKNTSCCGSTVRQRVSSPKTAEVEVVVTERAPPAEVPRPSWGVLLVLLCLVFVLGARFGSTVEDMLWLDIVG
eukprot:TRINITY_DN14157_c0_g1_i5.p1 TRINITY_DN14157_c0_g1~~TRINITY_DN14157_c0_g1_i5.p1  ORF type:complete len:279 (-),score=56.81 TRINITY_DN14157_c0_g1_i5:373-1209(-)